MFYNMATLTTVTFSPVIGGYVSEKHGWRTQFYILAGFIFIGILLLVFLCPEHAYNRPTAYETDVTGLKIDTAGLESEEVHSEQTSVTEKQKSYGQELKPFSRNIAGENPLVLLARPLVCMCYPAVIWAFLLGGCWSTWVSSDAQYVCRC